MRIHTLILLASLAFVATTVTFTSCGKDQTKETQKQETQKPEEKKPEGDLLPDGRVRLSALTGRYEGKNEEMDFVTEKKKTESVTFDLKGTDQKITMSGTENNKPYSVDFTIKENKGGVVTGKLIATTESHIAEFFLTFTLEKKEVEIVTKITRGGVTKITETIKATKK